MGVGFFVFVFGQLYVLFVPQFVLKVWLCSGNGVRCQPGSVLLSSPRFRVVNGVSNEGSTALHDAAAQGHTGVCRLLLEADKFHLADAQDKCGRTPLHDVACKGNRVAHLWTFLLIWARFFSENPKSGSQQLSLRLIKGMLGQWPECCLTGGLYPEQAILS